MSEQLNILHLEDDPDYAEYVREALRSAGVGADVTWVSNATEFKTALTTRAFDLILADYFLPDITGTQALSLSLEHAADTPFLVLSGTIGEQAAVESLRSGAADYVLKQWPERLVPAITRAVAEARERQRRHQAEAELLRREKYLRSLTEHSLDLLTILDAAAHITYSSPSVARILGYTPAELEGQCVFELAHPEDLERLHELFRQNIAIPGMRLEVQARIQHHDGHWVHLEAVVQNCINDPDIAGVVINSRDVTQRVQAEVELRESERQHRIFFHDNPNPMWVFHSETQAILEVNDAAIRQYGYTREEFMALRISDIRPEEDRPALTEFLTSLKA